MTSPLPAELADRLKRTDDGLVCAVVQAHGTGEVLMVAWMNDQALHRTLTTRRGTYYSRSRQNLWVKGETSGHTQYVREVRLDCDGDAVLVIVDQTGPACHTGLHSCFETQVLLHDEPGGQAVVLPRADPVTDPIPEI
jgi:phosphoribosyl-AMP cyclohydrolase